MKNGWPNWAGEMRSRYMANVSHQFLLFGNIDDYVLTQDGEYLRLHNFLEKFLSDWKTKWDIVVFYDLSSGLRFADDDSPRPKMKDCFYEALGQSNPDAMEQAMTETYRGHLRGSSENNRRRPQNVLPMLDQLLADPNLRLAVIIEHAGALAPNGDISMLLQEKVEAIVTFSRWALSLDIPQSNSLVILESKNLFDIHPDIRSITGKTETIEVPYPDMEERRNWADLYLKYRHEDVECQVPNIARISSSFNLLSMEDLWLRAKHDNKPVDMDMLTDRKREIQAAESGDLLTVIEEDEDFDDIGGMEETKAEFQQIAKRLQSGDSNLPTGALLLGPPGTGKSVLARALAKAVDVPLIQFLDVQEKWVGSSERNMRRALESLKRYDQAIVFIDEFDQAYGGRGGQGDSGVTSRLFGVLLEFIGDTKNRGKIFWLGATNRPDRIDPAMKRPGRFDRQFLFFPPDLSEREKIFEVMFNRRKKIPHKIKSFLSAASATEGFTGAEIDAVCDRSKDQALRESREVVEENDLSAALEDFIPVKDPSYELMTLLAVSTCNSRRQIPEPYRQLTNEELNKRITALKRELSTQSPTVWGI